MPDLWKKMVICPIAKNGDNTNCKNYRGIALLQICYKIFATVLRNILTSYVENELGEYQWGTALLRIIAIDETFSCTQSLFHE